jgi:hypothetical protein
MRAIYLRTRLRDRTSDPFLLEGSAVDAETRTLQGVLHGDRRFLVPIYQRPYVWELERQWEPLWDDVEATAVRLAEARVAGHMKGLDVPLADKAAAPHFLGAVFSSEARR